MPIAFKCPKCDNRYKVRDELAGQIAGCPCGARFKVPTPSDESLVGSTPPPPPPPSSMQHDSEPTDNAEFSDDNMEATSTSPEMAQADSLDTPESLAAPDSSGTDEPSATEDAPPATDSASATDDFDAHDFGGGLETPADDDDIGMKIGTDDLDIMNEDDASEDPTPIGLDEAEPTSQDDSDSDIDISDMNIDDEENDEDEDSDELVAVAVGGGWVGRGLILLGAACLAAGIFAPLPWIKTTEDNAAPVAPVMTDTDMETTTDAPLNNETTSENEPDADATTPAATADDPTKNEGDTKKPAEEKTETDDAWYIAPGLIKVEAEEDSPEPIFVVEEFPQPVIAADDAATDDDSAPAPDATEAEATDQGEDTDAPVEQPHDTATSIAGQGGMGIIAATSGQSPLVFMLYGALGAAGLLALMALLPGKILSGKGGMIAGIVLSLLAPGLLAGGLFGVAQASYGGDIQALVGNAGMGLFLTLGGAVLCLIGGIISSLGVFQGGGGTATKASSKKADKKSAGRGGRGKKAEAAELESADDDDAEETTDDLDDEESSDFAASADTKDLDEPEEEAKEGSSRKSGLRPGGGSKRGKPGAKKVSFAKKGGKKSGSMAFKKKASIKKVGGIKKISKKTGDSRRK